MTAEVRAQAPRFVGSIDDGLTGVAGRHAETYRGQHCLRLVPTAGSWHACLVVTYEEARQSAQRLLDGSRGGVYGITGDQEYAVGWVFFYDSRQHQESGSLLDALGGNAPILIDRDSGQACPTGTARPVEEYVSEYAERKRRLRDGWPDSLDARFLALLALVHDGMGLRDARHLDLLMDHARHRPREGRTVLDELIELERRGLVRREGRGTGYRWAVTDAGSATLRGAGAARWNGSEWP